MTDSAVPVIDQRPPQSCDVRLSIEINAPADVVFEFLTIPDLAFRWMGISGEIEPVAGGSYRVSYTEQDIAVGNYVEVTPHTRVSWTWGWEGSAEIPPGSSLVTFDLDQRGAATTVNVTHTGLPDVPAAEAHSHGWSYWGRRLAMSSSGGDPDLVAWDDTTTDDTTTDDTTTDHTTTGASHD